MSLTVTVNGDPRSIQPRQTIWAFLAGLELDPKKVAVERNREIVPKSMFKEVMLENGDQLEIVHFIGGG